MKKKYFLFCLLSLAFFSSCSSESDELSHTTIIKEEAVLKEASNVNIKRLFGQYSKVTRSIGIEDNTSSYDFSKSQEAYIPSKDAYVYMIPKSNDVSGENLLVGIGTEDNIYIQLYLEKTSENKFTLYNQDNEPIYDIAYDNDTKLTKVINCYGNDATIITPTTRALSKRTWSIVCNTAITLGAVSLTLVGAIPTMGASVGCTIMCGVASMAMC